MGTRSITRVFEDGVPILAMYGTHDGYPRGQGADIARFLASGDVVNGLGARKPGPNPLQFNGMGCLAAQLVANLKDGPGGIYLVATDAEDEEFTYEIHGGLGEKGPLPLNIKVKDCNGELVYDAGVEGFLEFCMVTYDVTERLVG